MIAEEELMEAVVLSTTRYALLRQHEKGKAEVCMEIRAARTFQDRYPVMLALLGGLLGPLAWPPAVLLLNEVVMRRVDQYKALKVTETTYSGRFLGSAAVKHHILRPLMDVPQLVNLNEAYALKDDLTDDALKDIIKSRSHRDHVSGKLPF
mmetsp:Transcript_4692/g.5982  ORF Transcript_4692/g.5982 Transcript_4692/m.5982 type:complete len:151 (-) Transcript_4692:24-476(-)